MTDSRYPIWEYKSVLSPDEEALNRLGEEGWEVVADMDGYAGYLVFLKRIRAEGPWRSPI